MAIEKQTLDVGSLTWFYREAKPINPTDKPPVLLLHGIVSQSYSWRGVMEPLAEQGFRAIAPDWIGSGFSAKPDKRDFNYTPSAFLTALEGLIEALELETFYLVVQGFVGSVGLQYALRHPERVERLMILNTPLTTAAKLPWKIRQLGIPFVGDMMTQDPLLVDRTLEGGGPYQVSDEDLDVYRRPFLKSSDAGRSLFATVQRLKLSEVTAEIEAGFKTWDKPTLVAWGLSDPWLPVAMAESFVNALPNGKLVRLEEVGHYTQEDWAEKVAEAIVPFLRQQIA
jgi:pimeloyl-ACP methyl ester carboxylesterase